MLEAVSRELVVTGIREFPTMWFVLGDYGTMQTIHCGCMGTHSCLLQPTLVSDKDFGSIVREINRWAEHMLRGSCLVRTDGADGVCSDPSWLAPHRLRCYRVTADIICQALGQQREPASIQLQGFQDLHTQLAMCIGACHVSIMCIDAWKSSGFSKYELLPIEAMSDALMGWAWTMCCKEGHHEENEPELRSMVASFQCNGLLRHFGSAPKYVPQSYVREALQHATGITFPFSAHEATRVDSVRGWPSVAKGYIMLTAGFAWLPKGGQHIILQHVGDMEIGPTKDHVRCLVSGKGVHFGFQYREVIGFQSPQKLHPFTFEGHLVWRRGVLQETIASACSFKVVKKFKEGAAEYAIVTKGCCDRGMAAGIWQNTTQMHGGTFRIPLSSNRSVRTATAKTSFSLETGCIAM